MAQRKPNAANKAPSQRQLRVGEAFRRAFTALATLLLSTPSYAEVCDKAAGESWRPEHGPVWLLNPVGGVPFTSLILVAGLFIAGRYRWVGYLGSAILVAFAAVLAFADLIPEHDIYLMQVREGCRSHRADLMNLGLMTAFAVAYTWFGYRAHRRAASSLRTGS
jgi:hypothetical protein